MQLPADPIFKNFDKLDFLQKIQLPKTIEDSKRLFSKGGIRVYRGDFLARFSNLTIKGMNFYHYDFGIAYPKEGIIYPLFMYQVIIAPDRILALVHFPFNSPEKALTLNGIDILLEKDADHNEMLLTNFKPQDFLKDEVLSNKYNGLIRTTAVDEAYEAITDIFISWYEGLRENAETEASQENKSQYKSWINTFSEKFYREDYGFRATRRYLGKAWATEVFEKYIFEIQK